MSDEVKKAQEEAQRLAKELGIYEMICNIVTNGANCSDLHLKMLRPAFNAI